MEVIETRLSILKHNLNPYLLGESDKPHYIDFSRTLCVAAALLALRWTLDRTVVPLIECWLNKHGRGNVTMKFFDDAYIVVWAIATEVFAVYITLNLNAGCKPWSTEACFKDWPHHPLNLQQRWYMLLMFQGYLHELVGGMAGIGPSVRTDMTIHHVATMTLISSAYLLNLSRMGIMWQALFDISNPLLHTAKMMNTLKFPQTETIKWYVFALFALAFFVARIVMAPISIVWPAVTQSTKVLPIEWSVLPLSMMVVVCGIQWLWFYKILRMAVGAEKEPGKEKTH